MVREPVNLVDEAEFRSICGQELFWRRMALSYWLTPGIILAIFGTFHLFLDNNSKNSGSGWLVTTKLSPLPFLGVTFVLENAVKLRRGLTIVINVSDRHIGSIHCMSQHNPRMDRWYSVKELTLKRRYFWSSFNTCYTYLSTFFILPCCYF